MPSKITKAAQTLGKRGGLKTSELLGKEHYQKLANTTNEKKRLKKLSK